MSPEVGHDMMELDAEMTVGKLINLFGSKANNLFTWGKK